MKGNFNGNDGKANSNNNTNKPSTSDGMMKRPLTLAINKSLHLGNSAVLSTPDLNMCKLGSPELENFILNTDTLQTPTPSGIFPPTSKVRAQNVIPKRKVI